MASNQLLLNELNHWTKNSAEDNPLNVTKLKNYPKNLTVAWDRSKYHMTVVKIEAYLPQYSIKYPTMFSGIELTCNSDILSVTTKIIYKHPHALEQQKHPHTQETAGGGH